MTMGTTGRRAFLRRSSIKAKPRKRKRGDDPARREWIRSLPCLVCWREMYKTLTGAAHLAAELLPFPDGENFPPQGRQTSATDCAHIGFTDSRRGLSQKFPDNEAAPLCHVEHHQEGPASIHKLGAAKFFEVHGIDRDAALRLLQAMYAGVRA